MRKESLKKNGNKNGVVDDNDENNDNDIDMNGGVGSSVDSNQDPLMGIDQPILEVPKKKGRKKNDTVTEVAVPIANNSDDYEVEDIIGHKFEKKNRFFLVRWKNCGPDDDTWEPESSLSCPDIVQTYVDNNPEAEIQSSAGSRKRPASKKEKAAVPAKKSKGKKKSSAKDDDENDAIDDATDATEADEEYEVDDIVDHKIVKGKTMFLIRWKNYDASGDTWEPELSLSCPEIIERYKEEKMKDTPKTKGSRKELKPKKEKDYEVQVFNDDLDGDNLDHIEEGEVEEEEYDTDSDEDEGNESGTDQPQPSATGQDTKNAEVTEWINTSTDVAPLGNLICPFPATAMEFYPLTGGYKTKVLYSICFYEFNGNGDQRFYVAVDTLKFLLSSKHQKVKSVDVDFLMDTNIELHQQQLKDKLKDARITFSSVSKQGVFLREKCQWSTLVQISKLNLPYDILVSGGGFGQFDAMSMFKNTPYQGQSSISYVPHHFTTVKENIIIGVIDTGSLPPNAFSNSGVVMHESMFNTNFKIPRYTVYCDNTFKHGTAIVEILNTSLPPKTKIYVARISQDKEKKINPKKIISALQEFHRLKVNIINCSFSGKWRTTQLCKTLEYVQSSGIIIIASAGNEHIDYIRSDLNNGKTILVGSYNRVNKISLFSNGLCKADICGFGENVVLKIVLPNIRNGTSYAVPFVSAVVANYMAFTSIKECASLKKLLVETAETVQCSCTLHNGQPVKLKVNPTGLMKTINCDVDGPTTAKILKIDDDYSAYKVGESENEDNTNAAEESSARGKKRKLDS